MMISLYKYYNQGNIPIQPAYLDRYESRAEQSQERESDLEIYILVINLSSFRLFLMIVIDLIGNHRAGGKNKKRRK